MTRPIELDGWPADSGPLEVLHRLGLVLNPKQRPGWIHYPKTKKFSSGAVTYTGYAKTLDAPALRALAALTFEGWAVTLSAAASTRSVEVTIRADR
jgi:hypothetical protein